MAIAYTPRIANIACDCWGLQSTISTTLWIHELLVPHQGHQHRPVTCHDDGDFD